MKKGENSMHEVCRNCIRPLPAARASLVALSLIASSFFCLTPGKADADSLRTVDGRVVEGTLVALTGTNAVMRVETGQRSIPAGDIAAIRFREGTEGVLMSGKGRHVLIAADGSALAAREVSVSNGVLRAVSGPFGGISTPMESLSCVLRPNANETPLDVRRGVERLGLKQGRTDILVVRGPEGKYLAVNAIVSVIEADRIVVVYDRTESAMQLNTIAALIPALPASTPPAEKPRGRLVCCDGSSVLFSTVEAGADRVVAVSPLLGRIAVPRSKTAEIRFRSPNLASLSDMAPSEVKETPYFDDEFPWRKDRSVHGAPLRLEGKTYRKGLGLHADCRMTFDLGGRYRRFTALAGIDDDLPVGKAELTILGDGRPLLKKLVLARNKAPASIELDIAGVRSFAIHVGFAEGTAGSGACVNLCRPELFATKSDSSLL